MTWYIDIYGNPHTGDRMFGDTEIPDRPNEFYVWRDGAWVLDADLNNAPIYDAIKLVEEKGHRPVRGIILAMLDGITPDPDDVAKLREVEAQVVELRSHLIGDTEE